jgi:hypothetical protein
VEANKAITSQGPGGNAGAQLRKAQAAKGKKLPILGDDDNTANFNYIKNFVLDIDSERLRGVPSDKKTGEPYGLQWAERFHYFGPSENKLEEYSKANLVNT